MKFATYHRSSGFTLIEIMITSALMIIVGFVANQFWHSISQNYSFAMNQYQLIDEATFTAQTISTEVRQAEEAMDGGYLLEILEDNQLSFYADVDNDGLVEKRRYFLENGLLKRGIIIPTGDPYIYDANNETFKVMLDQIDEDQLPLFVYYNSQWPSDQTNNPLTYWERPLSTRLIKIRIPVIRSGYVSGSQSFVAENLVMIRNLKDN